MSQKLPRWRCGSKSQVASVGEDCRIGRLALAEPLSNVFLTNVPDWNFHELGLPDIELQVSGEVFLSPLSH